MTSSSLEQEFSLSIRIETEQTIYAIHAARFLGCLTLIGRAARVATTPIGDEMIPPPQLDIPRFVGKQFFADGTLGGEWPLAALLFEQRSTLDTLEVQRLETGSIDTIVKDRIREILDRVRKALSAARAAVRDSREPPSTELVDQLLAGTEGEQRLISAGYYVLALTELSIVLREIGATEVLFD